MGVFTTTQQQKSRSMKIFHFGICEKANSLLPSLLIFGRKNRGQSFYQRSARINIIQILGSYLPFDNHFNVLRFSGLFLTIQDQLMETLS